MRYTKGMHRRTIEQLTKTKFLSAIIGLVVSFSMIITVSLAWFTVNRQTGADEMGMSISVDDTKAVYKVYMYDLDDKEGTNKMPDNVTDLNITNLDLNHYDTIFKINNKYTPAFARIELKRSEKESGTAYITISRNDEKTSDFTAAYSSSVLRFTGFIISDQSDRDIETPHELYEFISKDRFKEVETYLNNDGVERPYSKTFVKAVADTENHTHTKSNSITIEVPSSADAWYEKDGAYVLNIYLYITYDVQLITCYMDETTGDNFTLGDNTVLFENDLDKISVSYAND